MKFRKKPVIIEAMQYDGKNHREVMEFTCGSGRKITRGQPPLDFLEIETLEGVMYADKRDWIIKGIKGEFYPCKPDIFAMTYEAVEE
jgi:hypothetical protein